MFCKGVDLCLKILERNYRQTGKELRREFPNSQSVIRVGSLTDNCGYLLAVSTSLESSTEFGDYLEKNTDLEYLYVGGNYSSTFIGGFRVRYCR